ncbi:hypothetical protein JXB01_03285 [Candidatus Micrarchaeota archaeon]|nr:hypothetical protein [Candidatus Micrarchaeota archaeon]
MPPKKKKKVVDKWKLKKWYEIVAPKLFEGRPIGETVAADDSLLMNRIIEVSLRDLGTSTSPEAAYTKVLFRISDVKGNHAYTNYIGHHIVPGYLKMLARRNRSVIDVVMDVKSKDGKEIRLKLVAVTGSKVSENTKRNIREAVRETVKAYTDETSLENIIIEGLQGKISGKVFNRLKEITYMKKVELKKSRLKEEFA